jgi:hypothetical protein
LIIALIIALIVPAWLPGSAQSLSLNRHRSPNVVRGIEALQDAAIARRLLRRNPKRHGGDAIASVGREAERRLVVKCNAKRRTDVGLHDVL